MRRLRVQIWDETNEAEHWAPVSLTGKFRYYVLLSASNRCRTSPLWVGHSAHKQDQEEACDCSILCVSSKPSVSLLILNISWTILDDAGVPNFKKKHIITGDVLKAVWERLSHFSSVLWSLWPRCCPLPAAARMQPLLRLQLRLDWVCPNLGILGPIHGPFCCMPWDTCGCHPLSSTGRRIAGRDCRGCDILGLNPSR